MSDISTLISNVGFPIAAFLLMFWQQQTTLKKHTESIDNLALVIEKLDARLSAP